MLQTPDKWVLEFSGCTGFGAVGRACAIVLPNGDRVGHGYGATDAEALLEALTAEGWTFDRAFDEVFAILNSAVCTYRDCDSI